MKTTIGVLQVTLPNSYSRGGVIYYQRAVPKDLQDRYPTKLIKLNLETGNLVQAAKLIEKLNQKHEAEWAAMRANPDSSPVALKVHAQTLLRDFGLQPAPADNDPMAVSLFHDYLDSKREAYANGDEELYRENPAGEYLKPVEIKAAQLLAGTTKEALSDALEVYLEAHPKRDDIKFSTYARRAFQTLIEAIGDKPVSDLVREDAKRYVGVNVEAGLSTSTIRRRLNTINSVIESFFRERDLLQKNPFAAMAIPGEGRDAKKRKPYTAAELSTLYKACQIQDDPLRWLVALLIDTGARLAEITGLALDDIKIDAETPYVVIQAHPWRSLKNTGSSRSVPLVGASLWAAKRILETAEKGQRFAFPHYTTEEYSNANNASAAIGKWIKGVPLDHTAHELRHSLADRLREVQCPEDIRKAIGGWAAKEVSERYGYGYGLQVKAEWLAKIAL
ncbi:tyrosine-type recombinase/integrase [Duganella sp. FT109W]|uniref:Tyrosine-type recombinase/integrase n=1 Tax=Duganella margarita TaxID=2692170 RepID=A0ABW9WHB3_9BURK|nr:tyrosine-type recombinase/integrase [Duganella margarita]MYN39782.1 tyrosine-type recombinase/integrase [Duganella margarita]